MGKESKDSAWRAADELFGEPPDMTHERAARIIQTEAIDPETARLRKAVRELGQVVEQALADYVQAQDQGSIKTILEPHPCDPDGDRRVKHYEISPGAWTWIQSSFVAQRKALAAHATLIAECKAEKEG